MAGSQTFTSNITTVKTALDSGANSATYLARALAAAGPITDTDGMLLNLQTKFNEAAEIINYLIFGTMIGSGTNGIFRSGDSDHASAYDLLNNILTSLTS